MTKLEKAYVILVTLFCSVLIITNLVGLKIFKAPFSSLALTTGIITYPITFILSDVVTEIFGKKRANFMVYLGFFLSLMMFLIVQLMIALPPHEYWVEANNAFGYEKVSDYQNAYTSTFNVTSILIFASMLAFMSGQLIDVYLFQKIKELTKGKHLWMRNNGSTMVSQLVDTLIVNSIVLFLGFKMPLIQGLELMGAMYIYKLALSALSTPVTYGLVYMLREKSLNLNFYKSNI